MTQRLTEILDQRVHINIFEGDRRDASAAIACASLGLTNMNPIGCLIACPAETTAVYEGLQQINRMSVFGLPVRADAPRNARENMTGQIPKVDPFRNQKPSVVGDVPKVGLAGFTVPSDKRVTRLCFPGSRTEEQRPQESSVKIADQILEILPDRVAQPQVVMLSDEALEAQTFIGVLVDGNDRQG